MNGLYFLTFAVAFQGGIEFGWTQLPDNRVEYIIQLDEPAIQALKNGQALTSSIPDEVASAQRIRIQFGEGVLDKPILSRKPQAFPNVGSRGPGTPADQPPSLYGDARYNPRVQSGGLDPVAPASWSGQITTSDGNQTTVSNSTLNSARPTAFVTQERGTNGALTWSNSNRVIGNYDDQNRTADTRARINDANSTGASRSPAANPAIGSGQPTGASGNPANTYRNAPNSNLGNPATGSSTNYNGFNRNAATDNSRLNSGNALPGNPTRFESGAQPRTDLNMTPVRGNRDPSNWTSVDSNRPAPTGTGFQAPAGTSNGYPNPANPYPTGQAPAGYPGGNYAGNPQMPANTTASQFPNTQYPTGQYAAQPQPAAGNYFPSGQIPVSAPAGNSKVDSLEKRLEQWEADKLAEKHQKEIDELNRKHKEALEKLREEFLELKKEKKDDKGASTSPVVTSGDSGQKGSTNGIASVFLVISLGLNVFLVVQYLSVQNQFRDLSNDLRDTFMSNNYE